MNGEPLHTYARAAYEWLKDNPLYVWGALSAVLNVARHYKWLERLEATHYGGAVLDLVRATGLDPVGVLRFLSLVTSSKAASLGAHVIFPPSSSDSPPTTPRNTGDPP